MNKAELIDVVAKKIDGTKKEAEAAVRDPGADIVTGPDSVRV